MQREEEFQWDVYLQLAPDSGRDPVSNNLFKGKGSSAASEEETPMSASGERTTRMYVRVEKGENCVKCIIHVRVWRRRGLPQAVLWQHTDAYCGTRACAWVCEHAREHVCTHTHSSKANTSRERIFATPSVAATQMDDYRQGIQLARKVWDRLVMAEVWLL